MKRYIITLAAVAAVGTWAWAQTPTVLSGLSVTIADEDVLEDCRRANAWHVGEFNCRQYAERLLIEQFEPMLAAAAERDAKRIEREATKRMRTDPDLRFWPAMQQVAAEKVPAPTPTPEP